MKGLQQLHMLSCTKPHCTHVYLGTAHQGQEEVEGAWAGGAGLPQKLP